MSLRVYVLCGVLFGLASSARAQESRPEGPGADERTRAAEAFDRGALAFRDGQFAAAARAFLEADRTLMNGVALANALGAALRAKEPLLIAQAAQRARTRADVPEATRQQAAEALANVGPGLARLELVCDATPCLPELDGEAVSDEFIYVRPGSHELRRRGQSAPVARIDCAAGSFCRVHVPAELSASAQAAQRRAASDDELAPVLLAEKASPRSTANRLPLAVLITTGAATLSLAALATWSGVKALHKRELADTDPERYRPETVRTWARRTDLLLIGTGLCAAAAAATAIWWVDWNPQPHADVALLPQGALISARGSF